MAVPQAKTEIKTFPVQWIYVRRWKVRLGQRENNVSFLCKVPEPELPSLAGLKSRSSAESESESYCIDINEAMIVVVAGLVGWLVGLVWLDER